MPDDPRTVHPGQMAGRSPTEPADAPPEVEQLRRLVKLHMGAHQFSTEAFIHMGEAVITKIADGGTLAEVLDLVGDCMNERDAVDEACEELYERALRALVDGQPAPDTDRPLISGPISTSTAARDALTEMFGDAWQDWADEAVGAATAVLLWLSSNDRLRGPTTPGPTRGQVYEALSDAFVGHLPDSLGAFDAMTDAVLALFGRSAPEPEETRRAAVAESIYQRHANGWHAVMHEIIEPPCWNRSDPDDTEPLTADQVAWMRGEPLPPAVDGAPEPPETQP